MEVLTKTENIIKIDPRDILHFINFIRNFLTWKREEREKKGLHPYACWISPSVILVPIYRYSQTPLEEALKINFKHEDIIKLENLSYFRPYALPKGNGARSWLFAGDEGGLAKPRQLGISLGQLLFSYGVYFEKDSIDVEWFERDIKMLSRLEGKVFPKSLDFTKSKTVESMLHLENGLLIIMSFLYVIYTGEYDGFGEDRELEYEFLLPFTKTFQSYGKTFEKALSVAKEVSMFIG